MNPVFLAFTTSDLSQYVGWPIEIGFASNQADGSTKSWSTLIRPSDNWDVKKWSTYAQRGHGIEFDDLLKAPAPADAAVRIVNIVDAQRCTLVVLDKQNDHRLLNMLLAELPDARKIMVISFDELLGARNLTAPRLERVNRYYQRTQNVLRAEASAAAMAYAYKQADIT
ncbi:hypothetical protein FGK63_20395 [Ruegeria sediminis]|uniref:Uncharacterized protein n=1 Tax=Ruegeria sediminis TaxID=2583820 RepID=A0ABY2WSR7_9RHOB|nr:hypothetical protein [Ruegeria sediminis]TMV02590.1 hypothetical protein FGK63_20395 [Ruegeria sediminis]